MDEDYAINSVAVLSEQGIIAVAAANKVNKTENGRVFLYDTDGEYLGDIEVGNLPDMVTFTPDGHYLLVANEGEPSLRPYFE